MANQSAATYAGRSIITARIRGTGADPKNIGWGTGAQTASTFSDVNLFNPATEARAAGTSTSVSTSFLADTYQVVGSITCLNASKTITEAGLFDTTGASTGTTLAAGLAASTTSLVTLGAAVGPATAFYAQLANEVVLVTAGFSTTLVTAVRGQLGSTAPATQTSGTVFTPGGDGGAQASGLGGQGANMPAGGSMFAHADFAGVAVSVNDSINFTFRDTFS